MQVIRFKYLTVFVLAAGYFLFIGARALSAAPPAYEEIDTPRFILNIDKTSYIFKQKTPVSNIPERALKILDDAAEDIQRMFGTRPAKKLVLRFLSLPAFEQETRAPSWTTGMFYRGEIIVPLSQTRPLPDDELERTLRHEYMHAVVADLSDFRCPAWLDEGLAQMVEDNSPIVNPGIAGWLRSRQILPFSSLQKGFTVLDERLVPSAYAQSLYSTKKLTQGRGFGSVLQYLEMLNNGVDERKAFERSFGISITSFETQLRSELDALAPVKR